MYLHPDPVKGRGGRLIIAARDASKARYWASDGMLADGYARAPDQNSRASIAPERPSGRERSPVPPARVSRNAAANAASDIYEHAYSDPRPEVFFKGTARICVGPGQAIGIRPDSSFTVPQPGLALVLGRKGTVLGYTLSNDVSAWDIERENPLYLSQAKTYTGSCALGPVIVTPDELPPLAELEMSCTVIRDGQQRFFDSVPLARLARTDAVLLDYLLRANPVPAGSVLMTGTGINITEDAALAPGDTVLIRIAEIGELVNAVALVQ